MPHIIYRRRARKTVVITAVIIIGPALLAAGFIWAVIQYRSNQDRQEFSRLQSTAQALVTKRHSKQAAGLWVSYARNAAHQKQYRAKAWQNAGMLYVSSADYADALTSFQNSVPLSGLTYNTAQEIAVAAARAGDTDVAIQYYQKAIDLMPSSIPQASVQKQLFENAISQLKRVQK